MKWTVLLCALLVTYSYAAEGDEDLEHVDDDDEPGPQVPVTPDFNARLDQIIRQAIRDHGDEIEPLQTADQAVGFDRKVGPLRVSGEVKLQNITLAGLSTLRRSGESSLSRTRYGNVELKVKLALGVLNYKTLGRVRFLGFGTGAEYTGRIEHIELEAVVHYHAPTEELYIKFFKLHELEGLTLKYKGPGPLGLLNAVSNQVIKATLAVFRPLFRLSIERASLRFLREAIRDSTFLKDIMLSHAPAAVARGSA